jgi:hypothetical protein
MVDLAKNRPDGVERVIEWLSDVAEAADMLGQKRTKYAPLVEQAHLHSIATLADKLFMHALPLLMEGEDADLTALAKRVARCKPGVRLASVDGPPKCPLGGQRPAIESYEQRLEKSRARWRAKKGNGKRKPYGATGPRPGSLNAARLQIRDEAAKPAGHIAKLMEYVSTNEERTMADTTRQSAHTAESASSSAK